MVGSALVLKFGLFSASLHPKQILQTMLPEAEEKEEKGGNLAIRMPVSYHNSSEPPVTACKVIKFAAKEGRWSCGFMDVDVVGASKKHWPFKRIIKFAIKPRECQAAPMNERRKCGK